MEQIIARYPNHPKRCDCQVYSRAKIDTWYMVYIQVYTATYIYGIFANAKPFGDCKIKPIHDSGEQTVMRSWRVPSFCPKENYVEITKRSGILTETDQSGKHITSTTIPRLWTRQLGRTQKFGVLDSRTPVTFNEISGVKAFGTKETSWGWGQLTYFR